MLGSGRGWSIAALFVLVAAGFAVRVDDLRARQMSHMEIFTPGLSYEPWALSVPHPRTTLRQTLLGSLAEPHPPAWYLAMYPWTRVFGASLFSIRFPSVLIGTLMIAAVYLVGALQGRRAAGLAAAAMVAFNGTLVMWSQISRPYIGATLLGVIATYLLLRLVATGRGRPGLLLAAYLATLLAGMLTNYYFWILFGTHLLWVVARSRERPELLPALARWQLALLIAVSPTVCLAIYQSYRPSYLQTFEGNHVVDFFSFGFLHDDAWLATRPYALPDVVRRVLLPATALVLWAAALLDARRTRLDVAPMRRLAAPPTWLVIGLGAAATAVCWLAWYLGAAEILPAWVAPESRRVVPMIAVPAVLVLVAFALGPLCRVAGAVGRSAPFATPVVTLAFVPMVTVLTLSLLVLPFQSTHHVMIFTPYVLLVLADGMEALVRRRSGAVAAVVVAALLVVLVPAHVASLGYHHACLTTPRDYRGLAAQWLPALGPDDVILVREDYRTTPIFYYVDGAQHRYVGGDYAATIRGSAPTRVWLVGFEGLPPTDEARAAVADFRRGRVFEASEARVEEYVRAPR